MSKSPCCTTAPQVVSHYKPKGNLLVDTIPTTYDLAIYEAPFDPNDKPSKLLICAYDIFGFHANTKEVCDKLAENGFRVVMPDFYRGDYWSEERSVQLMYSWVTYHGSWEGAVKHDIQAIIKHYKEKEDITSVGIFGFCWGGKISVLAGTELFPQIQAAGLVHPSGVRISEADRILVPVIILPSRDEINLVPFKNKVEERLGVGKSEHHRFENMHHGFCAARGNFNDKEVRAAVDKVISSLAKFFNKHLP